MVSQFDIFKKSKLETIPILMFCSQMHEYQSNPKDQIVFTMFWHCG
jgi:hypothetical protein